MSPACAYCGARVVVIVKRPKKLRRHAADGAGPGKVKRIKGHDLCVRCWQALLDRARARRRELDALKRDRGPAT